MIEQGYFQSGPNRLFYVYSKPAQAQKIGILFVHAANGNRLGPHRMFVELADRLNHLGFATLRFDLAGCGDSTGMASQHSIASDICDVLSAVNFFTAKAALTGIYLFGISRGARVCFSALSGYQLPASGAILLSTPTSTAKAAAKLFYIRLKEYIYKLKDPHSLRKLFTGRADKKQIIKTLAVALGLNKRYSKTPPDGFGSKCPLLFIYGQNDPVADESKVFYRRICDQHKIPYDSITIRDANHSFFHYKWKEEIFDITIQWLSKIENIERLKNE